MDEKKKTSEKIVFPFRSAAAIIFLPTPLLVYPLKVWKLNNSSELGKAYETQLFKKWEKCRTLRQDLEKKCDEFNKLLSANTMAKNTMSFFFRLKNKQNLLEMEDLTENQSVEFRSKISLTKKNVQSLISLISELCPLASEYYKSYADFELSMVNHENHFQSTQLVYFYWSVTHPIDSSNLILKERLLLFETCMAAYLYQCVLYNWIHLQLPANFILDEHMSTILNTTRDLYLNVISPRLATWGVLRDACWLLQPVNHGRWMTTHSFFEVIYYLILMYYYDEKMISNLSIFEKDLVTSNNEHLGNFDHTPSFKKYMINIRGIVMNRNFSQELAVHLGTQFRIAKKTCRVISFLDLRQQSSLIAINQDRVFCCECLLHRYASQLLYSDKEYDVDARMAISRYWKVTLNEQIRDYLKQLNCDINVRTKRYKQTGEVDTLDILGGLVRKSVDTRNKLMVIDLIQEYWISLLYYLMDSLDYETNYTDAKTKIVFNVTDPQQKPEHQIDINVVHLSKKHGIPLDFYLYLDQKENEYKKQKEAKN